MLEKKLFSLKTDSIFFIQYSLISTASAYSLNFPTASETSSMMLAAFLISCLWAKSNKSFLVMLFRFPKMESSWLRKKCELGSALKIKS